MTAPHPLRRVGGDETFVGRGLRDVWTHFNTELLAGIRAGYPQATTAMNQVMMLIEPQGITVSELARRAGVTKQSMAESVRSLEDLGLVVRTPDPGDRRACSVTLTEEGWKAVRVGLQVATAMHRRWTELLGPRDMASLVGLLERLAALLDAQDRDDEAAGRGRPGRPPPAL